MFDLNQSPQRRYRRAALIYNPFAGRLARSPRHLQRLSKILSATGIEARLIPTEGPNTAAELARAQLRGDCDLVIAAGGDGTINEVANGLIDSDVPLAILPGGTANVLAHELGISRRLDHVAASLSSYEPCLVAVGQLRRTGTPLRSFVSMAGVGLDAQIVHDLNLSLKAAAGKLAYYLSGFGHALRRLPEFTVHVDGAPHRASFALVSRVRNYGGDLEIATHASLLQPEFGVVLFRGTIGLQYIPRLIGVLLKRGERMPGCTFLRASQVVCEAPTSGVAYVQVDGELAGTAPLTLEIAPSPLNLLVPPAYLVRERRGHHSVADLEALPVHARSAGRRGRD